MNRPTSIAFALGALLTLNVAATTAAGAGPRMLTYEVTITNLTRGVSFTPFLVASHLVAPDLLFTPGEEPSDELAALAEGGDTAPLTTRLLTDPRVWAVEGTNDLLAPGQSATVSIQSAPGIGAVSLAAMLLPTNDGMVALQDLSVPSGNSRALAWAYGYDAGSEPNDELCTSIPGPHCGGAGGSPGVGGEGYVHIHAGILGIGDLDPVEYDWKNPIARVEIRRSR